MVLPDSHRVPRAPRYLGSRFESRAFCLHGFHILWPSFPTRSTRLLIVNSTYAVLQPQSRLLSTGLGCFHFARHYSGNHCCFLFLQVLRWFTSLGWLVLPYEFRQSYIGFPHSDIDGSMDKCSSPSLFAAFHVLHRLQVPRHSPHALSSLTIKLVHKQNTLANKQLDHYLFHLQLLCIFMCNL